MPRTHVLQFCLNVKIHTLMMIHNVEQFKMKPSVMLRLDAPGVPLWRFNLRAMMPKMLPSFPLLCSSATWMSFDVCGFFSWCF